MTATQTSAGGASVDFARLSPWAILHFSARTISQLVSNAFTLVPVVFGLYQAGSMVVSIAVFFGIVVLVVMSATLRYLHFSYLIQDATVQVKAGVLSKKQLNLPFHRIQNVNIEHPFYFRPLGLVTVKIDGAGSASEEVFLAALAEARGEEIRDEIRAHRQAFSLDTPAQPGPGAEAALVVDDSMPMLTRSLADLVLHGLTNNRAWIILGALGAVYGQIGEDLNGYVTMLGFDFDFVAKSGVIALVAIAIGVLVISIFVMATLSVLGSIVSYYKYELYRSADAFVVRRGLLTRHEINMRKSRIQSVRVCRDWLDMLIGRMNVVFEQISHTAGQADASRSDKHVLVPSVEPDEADQLTREAISADALVRFEFTPVSRRYFNKLAGIASVSYLAIGIAASNGIPNGYLFAFALVPLWALHVFLLYMSWKRWGLAVNAGVVAIRKGVIGVDHILIPAFKIQEVGRTRTPLMRRHELSSVTFSAASRSVSVPFLPDAAVREALDYCLFETESTRRSWM